VALQLHVSSVQVHDDCVMLKTAWTVYIDVTKTDQKNSQLVHCTWTVIKAVINPLNRLSDIQEHKWNWGCAGQKCTTHVLWYTNHCMCSNKRLSK